MCFMKDIPEKLKNARSKLAEIRSQRVQAQEALRQLDINEAAWLGFIEALSPYETSSDEDSENYTLSDMDLA
jgi:hypothetical protein